MVRWSKKHYTSRTQAPFLTTLAYEKDGWHHFCTAWIDPTDDRIRHLFRGRIETDPRDRNGRVKKFKPIHTTKTFSNVIEALKDLRDNYEKKLDPKNSPIYFPCLLAFTDGSDQEPPMPSNIIKMKDPPQPWWFNASLGEGKFVATSQTQGFIAAWIDTSDRKCLWQVSLMDSRNLDLLSLKKWTNRNESEARNRLVQKYNRIDEDKRFSFTVVDIDADGTAEVRTKTAGNPKLEPCNQAVGTNSMLSDKAKAYTGQNKKVQSASTTNSRPFPGSKEQERSLPLRNGPKRTPHQDGSPHQIPTRPVERLSDKKPTMTVDELSASISDAIGRSAFLEMLKGIVRGIQEATAFMDPNRYTDKSAAVVEAAGKLAAKHSNTETRPIHLAVALLDPSTNRTNVSGTPTSSLFGQVVGRAGGDIERLKGGLIRKIDNLRKGSPSPKPDFSQSLQTVLSDAIDLARGQSDSLVTLYHLIQAVARDSHVKAALKESNVPNFELIDDAALQLRGAMNVDKTATVGDTQYLKQHTTDMTALAREGKVDPVIGRDKETDRLVHILSKLTQNNPMILGESGVGKTAVVEGLARRIVDGDIPDIWSSCKLLSLDVGSVIAGTKHHGDLEDRLTGILKEIEESRERIIFFVDEIHLLMKSPGDGINIANLLKPMLARGQLHCIGATTLGEHAEYIEKDSAFERRFDQVLVKEPTVSETITILRGLKEKYECHHGSLEIRDEAIVTAATMAARYLTTRKLPASAIDLIDEAAATARVAHDSEPEALRSRERVYRQLQIEIQGLKRETDEASKTRLQVAEQEAADAQEELQNMRQKYTKNKQRHKDATIEVGPDQIREVVSRQTGIPVTRLNTAEKDRLLQMEDYLKEIVVGQKEAVASVSNAIRLQRSGLSNPNSPPSFLFCGASGTGKTLLTKALAEFLFDDPKAMIRFDMSEYQEKHSLSRLIGSPPGYLGHDAGGQLTEALRRRPYSILLLDEIEKASKEVLTVFLQLMDDGHITDGRGRVVNGRNCFIVMTSNLGANFIKDNRIDPLTLEKIQGVIRDYFLPEFLNRISETVIFQPLSGKGIRKIVDLRLGEIQRQLQQNSRNITIQCTEEVKDHLANSDFSHAYGARPLSRVIQKKILNPLANLILQGSIRDGEPAQVVMCGDQVVVLPNDQDVPRKTRTRRAGRKGVA